METRKILAILVLALVLVVWPVEVSRAEPMGTAFTYQGVLYDANSPAYGQYDFQFEVYDAVVDGNKWEGPVAVNEVNVVDGSFTAIVDFGEPNIFIGEALWLAIGVRPGELEDPNAYTPLEPRQELIPVPFSHYSRYSYYSQTAGSDNDWGISDSNMYSIPSGNVGIGISSPRVKLDVVGSVGAFDYRINDLPILRSGVPGLSVGIGAGVPFNGGDTYVGWYAGNKTVGVMGSNNTFVGTYAGEENTSGTYNTIVGAGAGQFETSSWNTFVGCYAGQLTSGDRNVYLGAYTGSSNTTGDRNTFLGEEAGISNSTGSRNVFIGSEAGYNETRSHKLYIANGPDDSNVLIYGDFLDGTVGIGLTDPCEALDVNGTARLRGLSVGAGSAVVADANGTLYLGGVSSRRYKTQINDLQVSPDAVLQLRPVSFRYKSSGQQDIGLVAEEVEPLAKDLVIYDKQGRPDGVKYDRVALYLLEVVKSQQERIEALEERLESLQRAKQADEFGSAKEVQQ